eukprot:5218976-Ditylum_brightwellii.AAC.1
MAITDQILLGWMNFIKGRVSKKWAEAQKLYLDFAAPNSTKHTEEHWAQALVLGLWNYFDEIWTMQNADLHGTPFCHATSSFLDVDIKFEYDTL